MVRAPRRWVLLAGVTTMLLGVLAGAAGTSASVWRQSLAAEQRLLPGVTVAGTELGTSTLEDARALVRAAADAALSRRVIVAHGDLEWELTARDVGGTTSAEDQLEAAAAATSATSLAQLAMIRWLGAGPNRAIDVAVSVPPADLLAFVDEVGHAVGREPQDATAEQTAEGLQVRASIPGRELDRVAAAGAVLTALRGATDRVELSSNEVAPAVEVGQVEEVLPALEHAVDAAMDRTVTITHGTQRWQVSPRSLAATPDLGPAVSTALAQHRDAVGSARVVALHTSARSTLAAAVRFTVDNGPLGGLLDSIAEQIGRDAHDATVDWASGWVEVLPGRPGRTLDRHGAAAALRDALAAGADTVELPVRETTPQVDALGQIVLVRQSERRVYLYENGEIVADWPVAVGQAGADTPTGVFTVGAKRAAPTWYNPAPNGWGAAMPSVVGPGPYNPLGLRAVNWMDGDRDTLIRFHGTANTGSIGAAASRGCVRLTNADVVALFDMVEPGATIVSLRE